MANSIKQKLQEELKELIGLKKEVLLNNRYEKLRFKYHGI